jgi:hypothetical protein
MVLGPSLLFCIVFPPMMALAVWVGKRRRAAQRRRIEAYRTSPESHLLKL